MIAATLSTRNVLPAKTSNWKSNRGRPSPRILLVIALLFVEKTERQEASSEDDIEETKSNRPYNPKLVSSGIFDDENDDPNHSIAAFFETPSTIICKQSKASKSASSTVNSTSDK